MKLIPVYILCILVVFAVGCAKPPLEEMENAREAVFRASNDPNASVYAASTLIRARISLQYMEEEAESKNFEAARTHAAEAIALAERAINEGRQGAVRAGDESAASVAKLRPEIEETERNVNGARYSNLKLDYDELNDGIVNAHESADKAEANQANGRYQEALDIAKDVRDDLTKINQKIAGAAVVKKK